MTAYRRLYIPGGLYFFTVVLADRNARLLTQHIDILRSSFRQVKQHHPFEIEAMVVLPDHLHCIWRLPDNDLDFSTRWSLIKSGFSRQLPKSESISHSRVKRRERGIWQRRFWEHCIRDEQDYHNHLDYIHWNPMKHGQVKRLADWPYSSFYRFVKQGAYPLDWCGTDFDLPE